MPQKDTLDSAAYTCMLVSYRRLSPQFQFSLSIATFVYLSQWYSMSPVCKRACPPQAPPPEPKGGDTLACG